MLVSPHFAPSSSLPCSAARGPLDLDRHTRHKSTSPDRYDAHAPVSSHRDYSPDSKEPKRSRYPRQDPAAPHTRSRYPESYTEGGRSKHADPYPEHLLPSRGKRGDRYPIYEPTETGRSRGSWEEETERAVRRKERPARPPPPQSPTERDKVRDRDRKKDRQHYQDRGRDLEWEKDLGKVHRRDREQHPRRARDGGRDRESSRDRGQSWDRHREKDRQRQKDRERARTRSRERHLEDPGYSRDWLREGRASWDEGEDVERERRARGQQRIPSGSEDVFEEPGSNEGRGDAREYGDTRQGEGPGRKRCHTHSTEETGTTASLSPGSAGVFVWCAGVAFCCGSLRWWVNLTSITNVVSASLLSWGQR